MTTSNKLPPMQEFNDIPVVPLIDKPSGNLQHSGPIWPNWDKQIFPRHCRNGIPFDKKPNSPVGDMQTIQGEMVWGGFAHTHFGHFISEHSTRILQSLRDEPNTPLLFGAQHPSLAKRGDFLSAPRPFREIMDWYGVDPEKIVFCTNNMKVSSLKVAVQAEQLVGLRGFYARFAPPSDYLDMLDENQLRNNLPIPRNNTIFVSRSKLPSRLGGLAASQYFDVVLEKLGVKIFYPELHSLQEQLATYLGADHLIMAEGSSVHGLQLLGRNPFRLTILNRRRYARLAEVHMEPRCSELNYLDAIRYYFSFNGPKGKVGPGDGMVVFDIEQLFESFKGVGLDLASVWNMDDYNEAVEISLKKWIIATVDKHNALGFRDPQKELIKSLLIAGYEGVSNFVKELLDAPVAT